MRTLRALWVAAVAAAALAVAVPAGAANECDGLQICVSVPGPWVVVPASTSSDRTPVEYQLTCPRGHIVGGLDARLSVRGIDVQFLGKLGSPVNPGVSTTRSAVFRGTYVGQRDRAPTFKPFIGCIPAAGGGSRVPTSVTSVAAFRPSQPITRRTKTVRVRPGTATIVQGCAGRERLVGAAHAIGFHTPRPPDASLVSSVTGTRTIRGGRVSVTVRGDAEIGNVRAVVQVQAVCSRVS